jgi:TetR/AcrR family transcriptional regulator, transcriptional repressor for nem operon
VRAARDLIHRASYAAVSVQDVCASAGVHRGSLYHFFPSKEALGVAVVEQNWAMTMAVLDEAFVPDVPPVERIERFFRAFGRMLAMVRDQFGATPGCPLGNLAAELSTQDGDLRAQVNAGLQRWTGYFETAIREAQSLRDVDRSVDPHVAATALLAHLQGAALLAKAYDQPALVEQAAGIVRLLLPAPH